MRFIFASLLGKERLLDPFTSFMGDDLTGETYYFPNVLCQGGFMPIVASKRRRGRSFHVILGLSVVPALGIASFRLTAWSLFSSDVGGISIDYAFISRALQALAIALVLVIDRFVVYDEKVLIKSVAFCALGMSIGAMVFLLDPGEILRYVGCALNGAASAGLLMGWGYFLCSIEPKKSAFSITLAFAVYGLVTWAFSLFPLFWLTALVALLPLASAMCLKVSLSLDKVKADVDREFSKDLLKQIPGGMVALLSICTLISMLAKLLVPVGDVVSTWSYRLYWPAIFVVIFIVFFVWMFVLKRDDQDELWPVFVLVIFSGLICYSSFSFTRPEFAASFLRATQECLMLFCWVVTTSAVFRLKLPRLCFFGISMLVFVVPPTLMSSFVAMLLPEMGMRQDQELAVATAAVMSLVLIALTVFVVSASTVIRSRKESVVVVSPSDVSDPLLIVVDDLAIRFGLTKREAEVSLLLARGYTLPQTAESLCISLDTVRSHSKSLYKKLDIHKKKELISLVEERRNDLCALREAST